MKLVIFGLSISSSWGNGHATLWRGLCRSLARLGHSVTFFEQNTTYYAAHRDYAEIPNGHLVFYEEWDEARARRELRDADVAIVTSYCPDGVAATDAVVSSNVSVRSFYDLDAPVTLSQLAAGEPVGYLGPRGLRDFDLVLSYTGGRTLTELRRVLGARRVEPLYGSVDPEVHHPVPVNPAYQADLSYLGTYAADRQRGVEELLITPARTLPEKKFLIGGSQYPDQFPWTQNIYFVRHVPPPEHAAFYCSSGWTLNVTRKAMADMGYCPSGRLFEAASCGAPILSDIWEGLESFFTPGEEIVLARHAADVVAALQMSPAEVGEIASAARERTLSCHTAARRAEEMVGYLEAACRPAVGQGTAN